MINTTTFRRDVIRLANGINGNEMIDRLTSMLEVALDEYDLLRRTLDAIHADLCSPFEWSADTPEAVWRRLERAGYLMPSEEEVDEIEHDHDGEVPVSAFWPWTPWRENA